MSCIARSNSNTSPQREDRGIAAPRPVHPGDTLGGLLSALEVIDCDCKLSRACHVEMSRAMGRIPDGDCPGRDRCSECPPCLDASNPCPHLEDCDHELSLEEWWELLVAYDPEGYRQRPMPTKPGVAITKRMRLALYYQRARNGESLFHPRDVLPASLDEVSIAGSPCKLEATLEASKVSDVATEKLKPWGRPPTKQERL